LILPSIATWYMMESKTYGRNKSKAENPHQNHSTEIKFELE